MRLVNFWGFILLSLSMTALANSNLVYTSVISTMKSPSSLSVNYKVNSRPVGEKSSNGKTIGVLTVAGLPDGVTGTKLKLSDVNGVSGRLTFTDITDPNKKFQAKLVYAPSRAQYPKLNSESTNMMGKLPNSVRFNVVVAETKPIAAGRYSTNLSVIVRD